MTVFLIFICALLIVVCLILWGIAMVALRLAPMYIMYKRRGTAYSDIQENLRQNRVIDREHADVLHRLEARLKKLEEEQVNDLLSRTRRG